MSLDRYIKGYNQFPDNKARCKKVHFASYMGRLRGPEAPDEVGAEKVVDLIFDGRLLFIPDRVHQDWYLVVRLPSCGAACTE